MKVNIMKGKTICFVFPCASSSSRLVSTLLTLDSSHSHPLHAVISLWNHNRSWMKHPQLRCWAAASSSYLLFSWGMFHNGGFCRALWILFYVFPNSVFSPQTIRECVQHGFILWWFFFFTLASYSKWCLHVSTLFQHYIDRICKTAFHLMRRGHTETAPFFFLVNGSF